MSDFTVRTIRLKINPAGDKDARIAAWKRIRQICDDGWRAANWIATGQLLNDQLIRRIYARRKIDSRDLAATSAVEQEFFNKAGFFQTKRQATTERDIKEAFPNLPPSVTNPLNQVVVASYNKEKKQLLMGQRSLRSYKQGMPVTVTQNSIAFSPGEKTDTVAWTIQRGEEIKFEIYYGRDKANFRHSVKRIIEGALKYSAPQIQYKDRDLFLLLPVQEPKKDTQLDPQVSVGVDLGLSIPACISTNNGPAKMSIGSADDFLNARRQYQARYRRLQRSLEMVKSGHGRSRKLKALDRLKEKEANFARMYNHFISKKIVDFSIKFNASRIKLELLDGFSQEHQGSFVLRNWSYFQLQELIKQKAVRENIEVVYVDPFHTSQTCSMCGNYEEGQRVDQKSFRCKKCGHEENADMNAARNIAQSEVIVKKKEDCQYYRQGSLPEGEKAEASATDHSPTL